MKKPKNWSKHIVILLYCDQMISDEEQCFEAYEYASFTTLTKAEVIKDARENGWAIGKKNTCPKCKERKLKKQ